MTPRIMCVVTVAREAALGQWQRTIRREVSRWWRMADSDVVQLNQLAYRYAAAVDACDVDAFLEPVRPACAAAQLPGRCRGAVAELVTQQGACPHTMRQMFGCAAHQMTYHLVDVDGATATGTLLCAARHLSTDPDDVAAFVNVIRYVDRYDRRTGSWRICDREKIRFLWSERHLLVDSGF